LNVINQNGTVYIDNKEYSTLNGNPALTALQRIYNAEGYADTITATIPNYKYYRRDHLGNNREVWVANTKKTIQRTQYYPSGLPWASNTGDNPGQQERKYNGKEFDEMNGYDTYDYGARGYYAAMGRFTSVDPHAEKYYSKSPYIYCLDNPVKLIDADGRDPGDFFGSEDNAAKDWGKYYNGKSIAEGKEYASTIYSVDKDGKSGYTYTVAAPGKHDGVTESLPPSDKPTKAIIHSHGKYENEFKEGNDLFSKTDLNHCDDKKADGYLAAPDGTLQKYDTKKREISDIKIKLPSDPNDPKSPDYVAPIPINTQTLVPIPPLVPVPLPSPLAPKPFGLLIDK